MFDAFELRADFEARRRMGAALTAAAVTLGALTVGVVLIANRPASEADAKKKVDVSFRPPPPPPEPAKIEKPPPPKPKPPPPPKPVVVDVPAPAPAPAPMVAPKEVPKQPNVESDVAVAAREVAVGGTGDGLGARPPAPDEDESPAPIAAIAGHQGPVNLPEDADPPEPDEENVQPEYPEAARTTGQESRVVLKIVIEKDGHVGKVQVLKGEEPFLSAALQAVQSWRYQPATLEGQPISVFKIVNLTFQLRE